MSNEKIKETLNQIPPDMLANFQQGLEKSDPIAIQILKALFPQQPVKRTWVRGKVQ